MRRYHRHQALTPQVDGRSNSFYGDGFAVWITRDRAIPGPVFGNQDYFNGLGIFFDT
jgi:mannose-binding lectin 2